MLLINIALQYNIDIFSNIAKKNNSIAVLFLDSSQKNKEILSLYEKFEENYTMYEFFLVDKQDAKNKEIFDKDDFQKLPQLYVMQADDLVAEPLLQNLTKEVIQSFFQLKQQKINIEKIGSYDSTNISKPYSHNGFLVFTTAECQHCNSTLNRVGKAAAINNVSVYKINCDALKSHCDELGIYNFPTVWVTYDGIPSISRGPYVQIYAGECQLASTTLREKRKTQKIPKQEKPEAETPPLDMQTRIQNMVNHLDVLNKSLDIVTEGKKTQKQNDKIEL